MLTLTREAIPYRVGEVEWYYADFDPPTMPASGNLLDGRTIVADPAPTAILMEGAAGTIDQVSVVGSPVVINGVTIEAGTGVRFRVAGLQPLEGQRETIVNVVATLSDGSVKPLGVRFIVED